MGSFFLLLFSINLILLSYLGFNLPGFESKINLIMYAFGGGVIHIVYATIINNPQNISVVMSLAYTPILSILLFLIFKKKSNLIAALTLLLFMIISLVTAALLAASAG